MYAHRSFFSKQFLGKGLFHCQNDQSSHGPAGRLLESALTVRFIDGLGFFSDEEVDICSFYNHPVVVVQPFFISNRLSHT